MVGNFCAILANVCSVICLDDDLSSQSGETGLGSGPASEHSHAAHIQTETQTAEEIGRVSF